MVAGREWLGLRTLGGLALLGLAIVLLWRPRQGRERSRGGGARGRRLVIVGVLMRRRDDPPDFESRVLAEDLAPLSVDVAVACLALAAVGCAGVAAVGWRDRRQQERMRLRGLRARVVGGGLAAGALLVVAVVPAAGVTYSMDVSDGRLVLSTDDGLLAYGDDAGD